jgi:hypothetical protein
LKKILILFIWIIAITLYSTSFDYIGNYFPSITNFNKQPIAVSDEYIYVGGNDNLIIFDKSFETLTKVASIKIGSSYKLDIESNRLFLISTVARNDYFSIYDLSDPINPQLIFSTPGVISYALDYLIIGDYLIIDKNPNTEIYDLNTLELLETKPNWSDWLHCTTYNDLIFDQESGHDIKVYEFDSDSFTKNFLFQITPEGLNSNLRCCKVINDSLAVIVSSDKLFFYSFTGHDDWNHINTLDLTNEQCLGNSHHFNLIKQENNLVIFGKKCIEIFDIENLNDITSVFTLDYEMNIQSLIFSWQGIQDQNDIYAINYDHEGLFYYQIENNTITLNEQYKEYDSPTSKYFDYPYIYCFSLGGFASTYDITDIESPNVINEYGEETMTVRLNKKLNSNYILNMSYENYQFIARIFSMENGELQVEKQLPIFDLPGYLFNADIENNRYWFNDSNNNTISIYKEENSELQLTYSKNFDYVWHIELTEDYLYILMNDANTTKIETYSHSDTLLTSPISSQEVNCNLSGYPALHVFDNYMKIVQQVPDRTYFFRRNGLNISYLGSINKSIYGRSIYNNLLLSEYNLESELKIWDLNQIDSPNHGELSYTGEVLTERFFEMFQVDEDLYLVSHRFRGYDLYTIDISVDNEVVITPVKTNLKNYPNPFTNSANSRNSGTNISFSIEKRSDVEISVYNSKGQKVKTLTKENYDAGEHSVFWNGKNENNQKVASGVYLYRMNVDGRVVQTNKCLVVK